MTSDVDRIDQALISPPDTESVAGFVPSEGIFRLELRFDIDRLREALHVCLSKTGYREDQWKAQGFGVLPLTRRVGEDATSANDLSGRYWTRVDSRYVEAAYEELVDEAAYREFDPRFAGTYFEEVHRRLLERFPIGRLRVLSKAPYNCNSWHRDPEPRLHIPIISNPGSLFVVNHHVTHLPADGSVYFTDTRAYHMAMNGGRDERVHLVATLAYPPQQE